MQPSITPMLATAGTALPTSAGWAFEPRYDGIRVIAIASANGVQLLSRNGIDKAPQFPEVVEALRAFAQQRHGVTVLDVELVGLDGAVLGRFQSMQARVHERDASVIAARMATQPAAFRARGGSIRLGEAVLHDGEGLMRRAQLDGWEGIMAKRVDAPYAIGARCCLATIATAICSTPGMWERALHTPSWRGCTIG